jgi:hypothetical protein
VEYTPSIVGPGTHTITAKFAGDASHAPSPGQAALTVAGRASSVAVSCGPGVLVGQTTTCTVTVRDTSGGAPSTPTGTFNIESDTSGGAFPASAACTLHEVSTGVSACLVQYTPGQVGTGTHTIGARYPGDEAHAASEGSAALAVSAPVTPPPSGGGTTVTPPPANHPGAPKCRLEASEQWKAVSSGKRRARKSYTPMLLVPYTCTQDATVRIAGTITVPAAGHGRKHTKAKTYRLVSVSGAATAAKAEPAAVVGVPAPAAKSLSSGLKEVAVVTFTVQNVNGVGAATLTLTLLPRTKHK